ncbi:carbamoyltransferase HypF [Paludibacterium yongneupense]|uniref:carbamoyltransferase HypF n=1 Tax=Paludibacterium yongneupense TaxID=400061 RepID=UPI00042654C4|nr:carbamoyltransferase HypF [Paludibacterium yongneupense]
MNAPSGILRRRLTARGLVQGVGFRPFVYRLAHALALDGWVRNDDNGVTIEVQGDAAALADFERRLQTDAPPLARVDAVTAEPVAAAAGKGFVIAATGAAGGRTDAAIGPDSATCPACLAELFDPANRRHRYAFINCTDCGPRYTIARALPYDRAATSMAPFAQCPPCLAEYREPAHRRFHAEPNACPECGPQLTLYDAAGEPVAGDALAGTLARLRRGDIVAIKGLGGFHLVCDAGNPSAVARLRLRKGREEKPLAIMLAAPASVSAYARADAGALAALARSERPILLLPKRADTDALLPGVAPGLSWLGVMLPYTPLHYLLFHEAAGRPAGTGWLAQAQPLALVMTSANPGGEPLVIDNDEAFTRLAGLADAWLMHDRAIVTRCDDSVARLHGTQLRFIRRARGYTPRPVALGRDGPPVLALGAALKTTLCLTRHDQAFLSQHIGDLDRVANCLALEAATAHLCSILRVTPAAVAHDANPDFFSTRLARRLAQQWGVPALAVQHHHAHIGAVLAEHPATTGPVLGLALDGVGLGSDGRAWGGELLRVDGADWCRLGHLSELALPGGDRAAREPWRMAAAALFLLGRGNEIGFRFADEPGAPLLARMLAKGTQSPPTSSMGRWFDAAAGLLGVSRRCAYEGQAAMRLEGLLAPGEPLPPVASADYRLAASAGGLLLDLAPLAARLADETDPVQGAAVFHATLIEALAEWVAHAAREQQLDTVACGGGCFLNAVLADGLERAFAARGLKVLMAAAVPPGDGGLSLGQAWVARARLQSGESPCV